MALNRFKLKEYVLKSRILKFQFNKCCSSGSYFDFKSHFYAKKNLAYIAMTAKTKELWIFLTDTGLIVTETDKSVNIVG